MRILPSVRQLDEVKWPGERRLDYIKRKRISLHGDNLQFKILKSAAAKIEPVKLKSL